MIEVEALLKDQNPFCFVDELLRNRTVNCYVLLMLPVATLDKQQSRTLRVQSED
jgi:hypothetical protein